MSQGCAKAPNHATLDQIFQHAQQGIFVDADLSTIGPNLTILGGMEKGEALVGADYRDRPDFWRLS